MHRTRLRTRIQVALAAAALSLLAASAAQASTVVTDPSGALVVTAGPERNDIGLQAPWSEDGRIVLYDGTGTPLTSATGACEQRETEAVVCAWNPAAGVRVDLGGGNDEGYVSFDLPANAVLTIAGGEGDDKLSASQDGQAMTLDGGAGADKLEGGPGPDTLLGGDGNDELKGAAGSDRLLGEGGDDLLSGDGNKGASPDLIDGGAGFDTIESDWQDETTDTQPINLTLAGGADDGRPGEGDDVQGVESITAYQGATMVGTDAGEHLEAFQTLASSTLIGNGGDDELRGGGGADTIDGGAGNDLIDAGFGDDRIVGGPGRDTIFGDRRGGDCGPLWCTYPYGNDTIEARDGEVDSISCGFGEDTVIADDNDVVDSDCETVLRGAAAGAAAGKAGAGGKRAGRACVVPPLKGLKAKAAKRRLAKAHCKAKLRFAHSRKVKRGRVVKASAKPKRRLAGGAVVTITVSRGR